jgi:hypothetical protein
MVRAIIVEKRIGYIGTTNFTTKNRFRLVFIGPWTNMDRSYVVQLWSINIWVGPGLVAVAVAPLISNTGLNQTVRGSDCLQPNHYTKRRYNQQLYCWLPDSIYTHYGNCSKLGKAYTDLKTLPVMDQIDEVLTINALDKQYSISIQAALTMGKKTLNWYYSKTDFLDVYRIAMSTYHVHN